MRYALLTGLLVSALACAREQESFTLQLEELPAPADTPAAEPNLAADADGNIYFSWIEKRPDTTHALKLAVLRDGRFDAPRTIAQGRDWFVNWADFPMVTRLPSGELAAHWLQRNGGGRYAYGVRVALSKDNGQTWSEPITPHRDPSESEHGFVSLFPHDQQFGAVWLDGRRYAQAKAANDSTLEEMQLRFTTIAANAALGEDQAIDERTCDCCQTSVAVTERGPIVAYRDRTPDEIRDIYVARYENGGWTPGKPVHNDNWKVNYCPVNGPVLAARGSNVAIAWFTAADSLPRVNVAFSSDAGASFGAPIRVDGGKPKGRVDVELLDDNTALVSWLDDGQILVRKVERGGEMSTPVTVSATSNERSSGFPRMVVAGDQVVFAWTQPGQPSRVRLSRAVLK